MLQKVIGILIGFFIIIGVKSIIKYQKAENAVSSSAYKSWPSSFRKNFRQSCESKFKNSIKKRRMPTQKQEKKIDSIAKSYCYCITSDIESRKILPTKFNPLKESEEEFAKRAIGPTINNYIHSKKGKEIIKVCLGEAI
jgi:hypothetical protein